MLTGADTVLEIDCEALRLRPSLRAALRLERQFGFAVLLSKIGEGSISALVAIAAECGDHKYETTILAPSAEAWSDRYERITPALVALVFELADVEPQAKPGPKIERPGKVERITLAEAFEQLFGVATGVLGWSPATAWSATPAEIKAALEQRVRMLRAQAGVPEPEADDPFADQLDSVGLAALGSMNQG